MAAYGNGANDNYKGVATLYGSGTTDYRGALFAGRHVGENISPTSCSRSSWVRFAPTRHFGLSGLHNGPL